MRLNYNHGVLISDELFDAYLKCKTKAQLTFGQVAADEPSRAISDWQRRLADKYRADCCDYLQSADSSRCLVGSPCPEDLRSAKYRLVIQPYITAQGVGSNIQALERGAAQIQKRHSRYTPIRFVPDEKISRYHKLVLAFDAFVLWKASGQMPTNGVIIHGLKHTTLGVKLDAWIHDVEALVGKLRGLLEEGAPPDPVLIKHCSECIFEARCRKRVVEKDDLSLLVGLGTIDRVKLNAKGIFTVTQLAYTFRPRRRPRNQASRREKYHHALKALAIRNRKIHVVGKPELAINGTPFLLPDRPTDS